jgi:hypothetical protein
MVLYFVLLLFQGKKSATYQGTSVSKMRRIWCEDCRVVQMQFKQANGKWEQIAPDS